MQPTPALRVVAVMVACGAAAAAVTACSVLLSKDGLSGEPINSPDGSGTGSDPGIHCGGQICSVPEQVCCFDNGAGTGTCTPAGQCTGAVYTCDDGVDCSGLGHPGFPCCAQWGADGGPIGSSCVTTCKVTNIFCDPSVADACTGGCTIIGWGSAPPNLYVCR